MLTTTKIRAIATASVVAAALSSAGVASAAAVSRIGQTGKATFVAPPTTAAVSAFPTGGKGSGTEATCGLWSGQLNEDQGAVDAAVENNDLGAYQDATATLEAHKDDAMDAGCVVID